MLLDVDVNVEWRVEEWTGGFCLYKYFLELCFQYIFFLETETLQKTAKTPKTMAPKPKSKQRTGVANEKAGETITLATLGSNVPQYSKEEIERVLYREPVGFWMKALFFSVIFGSVVYQIIQAIRKA